MQLTTKKGYGFFEASSAFQKGIRRGEESVALYFAVEFFNSGYDEYAWKRMKIIASEDIGMAVHNAPVIIQSLYQSYTEQKKENKDNRPERIFYMHAVIYLCRAPKSRLIDYAVIKHWREHDDIIVGIPDYAFDKHTLKGKQMGRGLDHFYTEGNHVEKHAAQPMEQEWKDAALHLLKTKPGKLVFEKNKKKTDQQTFFDEP